MSSDVSSIVHISAKLCYARPNGPHGQGADQRCSSAGLISFRTASLIFPVYFSLPLPITHLGFYPSLYHTVLPSHFTGHPTCAAELRILFLKPLCGEDSCLLCFQSSLAVFEVGLLSGKLKLLPDTEKILYIEFIECTLCYQY